MTQTTINKWELADFENIEEKLTKATSCDEYGDLVNSLKTLKNVYVIGNGGLHYVASHMATDLSRLVSHLNVCSFDSVGFITSNANDHGYENIFTRWLETINYKNEDSKPLILGLSCSGKSKNIINALNMSIRDGCQAFLISGIENKDLITGIKQIHLDCNYYHTVEALTLMIFYNIIHSIGFKCPSIKNN